MRTAADGWLTAERIGRRTKWHLTADARQLLSDGARRIYTFTGAAEDWDGRWLLVAARVPESDRHAPGTSCRSRLSWTGFGSLAPGLWISTPNVRPRPRRFSGDAGIARDAHVFIATRAGVGDVRTMVSEGPGTLHAIENGNTREFREEFGGQHVRQPPDPADGTGACLATIPDHRPGAAPEPAARAVERRRGRQTVRTPARAMGRRSHRRVGAAQQSRRLSVREVAGCRR